ncbi:IS110 family transposase [Algoriphagus sp.]|uniref:IS110 family transposase n=1 Tax=Algoriphagus sp. TaxID=1872435 RepID=UPI00262D7F29|nr:IS110 family transposase [Algoriphagus sp.]
MKAQTVNFDQLIARGCGIDVHKSLIVATIKGEGLKEETRSYDGFTESLEQLRDWLKEHRVTHVAMESTGVYWKPVYNILEEDFEVILVNARHIKNVPGHKTDKKDSKWIAKLLLCGLLKGSFIPPKGIRELRDLTRYKRKIINQIASEKNRIQKILEDANIKLSSVISDMSGAVATKIIKALIEGEEDVDELVKFRHGKMRCTKEELAASLRGRLSAHHRFMLQTIKESISEKDRLIARLNEQIDKMLQENQLELDAKLLETIPGVGKDGAAYILAEIGNDMDRFPNEQHLASWAGMSPGSNESAGKKKSSRTTHGDKYLKSMLTQFAWAATRTKNTYLRSKYESLVGRRGKKKALVAIGHKILIAAYFILKDKTTYKELGAEYLESRKKDRQIQHYLDKLRELGVELDKEKVA